MKLGQFREEIGLLPSGGVLDIIGDNPMSKERIGETFETQRSYYYQPSSVALLDYCDEQRTEHKDGYI